jgi:hypothetical protein
MRGSLGRGFVCVAGPPGMHTPGFVVRSRRLLLLPAGRCMRASMHQCVSHGVALMPPACTTYVRCMPRFAPAIHFVVEFVLPATARMRESCQHCTVCGAASCASYTCPCGKCVHRKV